MLVNFLTTEMLSLEAPADQALSQPFLDRVAVIILGGGEGKRLAPLTTTRCKPAISFGGRYTLIDIPISHALSTGLTKIFVIGQYLAYTLQKHLFQTYLHYGIAQNHIQLLVPEEREGEHVWFKGTADAIRQNLRYFSEIKADYFLILSGDQLYNINFQKMIQFGIDTNASMVIASQPVAEKEAKRMGLLKLKPGSTKVIDFVEKPQDQAILQDFKVDDLTLHQQGYEVQNGRRYLGSMGIYLFKREALFDLLKEDLREDFGRHLINTEMKKGEVHSFLYDGYWEDIGTIESYYHANLALTQKQENRKYGLICYDEKSAILTKSYRLPGAKISQTEISQSIICEGSIIEAKEISHSIVGVRTLIGKGTIIRDTIIMGNETYEMLPSEAHQNGERLGIGRDCLILKAIIDENVKIGDRVTLTNTSGLQHYDSPEGAPKIHVRDGIIVIPRGSIIPDGFSF